MSSHEWIKSNLSRVLYLSFDLILCSLMRGVFPVLASLAQLRRLRTWPDVLHLERQRSGSEISPAFLVSATHGGWLSGKSLTHPCIIKIFPYLDKISWGSKIFVFYFSFVMQNYHFWEVLLKCWTRRKDLSRSYKTHLVLCIRQCNKPSMAPATQAKTICKLGWRNCFMSNTWPLPPNIQTV